MAVEGEPTFRERLQRRGTTGGDNGQQEERSLEKNGVVNEDRAAIAEVLVQD